MGHQLAVGEDLPGVQHPGLQKLRLGLRRQVLAARQGPAVALDGEGYGKLQGADAALPVRRVEHRDPDGAGELRLPVPQFPAVKVDLPIRLNDAGDIGAVVRHDGLRRLLLGERQLPARLIGVQRHFFQFQFHNRTPSFPGRYRIHVLLYAPPGPDMFYTLKIFFRMPRSILGDFQTTIFIKRLLSLNAGSRRSRSRSAK